MPLIRHMTLPGKMVLVVLGSKGDVMHCPHRKLSPLITSLIHIDDVSKIRFTSEPHIDLIFFTFLIPHGF